jgi:hypothetical protein
MYFVVLTTGLICTGPLAQCKVVLYKLVSIIEHFETTGSRLKDTGTGSSTRNYIQGKGGLDKNPGRL